MKVLVALLTLIAVGCSSLPASSPELTQTPSGDASSPPPSASSSPASTPSPSGTPISSPSSPPDEEYEFIRWSGGYKILTDGAEPGSPVYGSQDIHAEQIAAVIDKVEVDGVEWIRVQYGHDRPGDWVNYGWAPSVADIDRGGGTHVDPVYEYVVPECPDEFTIGELGGMVPAQALFCFGDTEFTLSPVRVRNEGNELDYFVDGSPEWLALGDGLVAHWLPGYEERGAAPVYVDPDSGVSIPEETWVELTGQLDHPAAQACEMTSTEPEIRDVRNQAEAEALCRGRFVVTEVRELTEAEVPLPAGRVTPGPEPSVRVDLRLIQHEIPIPNRYWSSSAWGGESLFVWGGWDATANGSESTNDGFMYTPTTGEFEVIPPAPIAGRAMAVAGWTGSELLVWGGESDEESPYSDGAAYETASGRWRVLAQSPLTWNNSAAAVWTGTEWWIASGSRGGATEVAVYVPATDSWRTLPSIPDEWADTPAIAWTGSEIVLFTAAGLFTLPMGASEWVNEQSSPEWHAPGVWTGDAFVLIATSSVGDDALDPDYLAYPVAWDPRTGTAANWPLPPRRVYEPTFAGSHLLFIHQRLAFDLARNEWVALNLDERTNEALELVGHSTVWAGDRLLFWGGVDGCGGEPPKQNFMHELMPDWAGAAGSASAASGWQVPVARWSGFIPPTGEREAALFAC